MKLEKFETVNGFVVRDLPDAEQHVGVVRTAPKILQGGAKEMARAMTYRFALLERRIGGASAGVNAPVDERDDAMAKFSAELLPRVASGALHLDPAGSATRAMIADLDAADTRDAVRLADVNGTELSTRLTALGAISAAEQAMGGSGSLDGATVVIEGFSATGPTLAAAAGAYGAKVVGISTTKGCVTSADGFDTEALVSGWAEHGDELVSHLGPEVQPGNRIAGTACDVFCAGSKMGAINHTAAGYMDTRVLVPTGPIPFTTKAYVILTEKGTTVLPDFLTTAGASFADWPTGDADPEAVEKDARTSIATLTSSLLGGEQPAMLEACVRAEAFLGTWNDSLPFGRPFAP